MPDNDTIIGEVLSARDLVEYQNGSVVSRTIIKKDAGDCYALRVR